MAKIALVFLLVALVAVCNGARLKREEPAAPAVGLDLQPVVNEIKKLFSEENLEKLKAESEKVQKKATEAGDEALKTVIGWVKSLEADLEQRKAAAAHK